MNIHSTVTELVAKTQGFLAKKVDKENDGKSVDVEL